MRVAFRIIILMGMWAPYTLLAEEAVGYQGRHVYLIDAGLDGIYGSYWFALHNASKAPQPIRIPLMLPKETADWQLQEGLTKDDITLSDGGLILAKSVPPGETMVSIGFMVPASIGKSVFRISPAYSTQEFQVLLPNGDLQLESAQLEGGQEVNFSGRTFRRWSAAQLQPGQDVVITVTGVPEGRMRLWGIGALMGALLVFSAGALAWRTRP